MSEARRIVITHVHKDDAYYNDRDKIIRMAGSFVPSVPECSPRGYFAGDFVPDKKFGTIDGSRITAFYGIRYRKI